MHSGCSIIISRRREQEQGQQEEEEEEEEEEVYLCQNRPTNKSNPDSYGF